MKLYNTLSRKTEVVKSTSKDTLTLYTCGPTVYDYLTIGNWTSYVRWDILARTLRSAGFKLDWVMNITDVGHLTSDADEGEDKLEKGAKREGKSAWYIADFYTQDFLRGLKFLDIEMGEHAKIVKATDHIQEQIDLIKNLEDKGFTYTTGDGVYFDTSKLTDYGKLARLDIAGLKSGARVSAGDKRNITDFALWKFSPKDAVRDMEWDSPWGKGFPGWHIECSAMSMKYLGETIDIHTGGIDHIPVHHTNEIAQSEAATGKQFVRIWVHGNFLQVNDEKIAKSAGNGVKLQDITAKGFAARDIRMLVLQSHYRSESNFTWDILKAAQSRINRWQQAASLRWQPSDEAPKLGKLFTESIETIETAMQNDLSTPEALRIIDDVVDQALDSGIRKDDLLSFTSFLECLQSLLGFDLFDDELDAEQRHVFTKRAVARDSKNWAESDSLRDTLAKSGIGVNDTPYGQKWYRL